MFNSIKLVMEVELKTEMRRMNSRSERHVHEWKLEVFMLNRKAKPQVPARQFISKILEYKI